MAPGAALTNSGGALTVLVPPSLPRAAYRVEAAGAAVRSQPGTPVMILRYFAREFLQGDVFCSRSCAARRTSGGCQGASRLGVQGAHLKPLGLFLNPLGLFLRTSIPFI